MGWGNRDPEWRARRGGSLLRVESFPASSRAHFALASVALQMKDGELARKHFGEALRTLPADKDPALDESARTRLERAAQAGLERVGE